jgi:hypothetical protein
MEWRRILRGVYSGTPLGGTKAWIQKERVEMEEE